MNIYAEELEVNNNNRRLPNPSYIGKNGYSPEQAAIPAEDEQPRQEVLDQHRLAQFIITQLDTPIPSLQEMQDDLDKDDPETETLDSVKERIEAIKHQHAMELERLYALEAEEYLDEAHDRYLSKDDNLYVPEGENDPERKESYEQLERLYEGVGSELYTLSVWANDYENLRYNQQGQLKTQYRKIQELERLERIKFPRTAKEFNEKDVAFKQKVLRLFSAKDDIHRDRILTEYEWSSMVVGPLWKLYKGDKKFHADIMALRITLDTNATVDPRRRPSL